MKRVVLLLLLAGCEKSAADAGRELFDDPQGFSESSLNRMACSDCHSAEEGGDPERVRPGADLWGVAARTSWWGGQAATLLDAVDQCVVYFLLGDEIDPESDAARQLDEFLVSITPEGSDPTPAPMTIVENVMPIPLGDAGAGEAAYERACAYCHGDTGTGAGGLSDFILPDDTSEYDEVFPGTPKGLIVLEATRHGRFFGIGGQMPFFTTERLGDAEIGDILAYLNLPTE
jgi:thiosulfate dehydrogenase